LHIASIYLHKKHRSGALHPDLLGMSVNDIAVDCIASLFERNELGAFVQLQAYYSSAGWSTLPDEELLGCTRRLVFGCVNQQLSHLYRDADPSLEKLMRNLRNALVQIQRLIEVKETSETWVVSATENSHSKSLPLIPPEFLEAQLSPRLRERTPLLHVLHAVADIFEGQDLYRRGLPLTRLALSIRSSFSRLGSPLELDPWTDTLGLTAEEIGRLIESSLATVRSAKRDTYVEHGKVDAETYSSYFRAIGDILTAEFAENNGCERSFQEFLAEHLSGLTKQTYQDKHRCHMEYLAKLTRNQFLAITKREL
jgi:hypothetical protein